MTRSIASYSRFAIIDGTEGQSGLYGDAVLKELHRQPTVTEVRHIRTSKEPQTKDSVLVDPNDHASLVKSLKDIEVVFTFPDGWEILIGELQRQVASAAKEAGVCLFVPL